ncbi:alpha-E domain-containing protein [Cellulomonas shaoxiangyii]|uniref:Alpha-E domain-containing protein n=1 Tax=Cellulomonas shaoxiangyii TaxID=2566013 RepID=A0A4P7SI16_9CELL|nr:alpha-E domain-containing protein [Cellulomonas shaoxiangyii]QCB93238.1 alpha-E domain-containing protein [Cellulomonas shaoxiangyii]TGY78096.1 alpha-E domain-containing protein [Cellulomonas shaoxiangyii]
MLSRIAESLFWIGRYVERADDTARLLDVHVQNLLEDPWAEEDAACRSLLSVMDRPSPPPDVEVGREHVLDVLAYDRFSPSAIAGSLVSARENARRAREIVSTELWECLNATWNQLPTHMRPTRPHDYFTWVRERAAIVAGIMDGTTSRDETWSFMVLGRSIERADMTARLLTTRALAGSAGPGWTTLLRSCGAHEAFLRTYRGTAPDERAAGFLLLDRLFPRSIVAALNQAEACLTALEPVTDRSGIDDARRHLGHVRSNLEYRPLMEILDDLPREMELVQRACSAASDAIRGRYFPSGAELTWVGEAL